MRCSDILMYLLGLFFCISLRLAQPGLAVKLLGCPCCWEAGNGLECFPLVSNLSHWKSLNSRLFENGFIILYRLMCSSICFHKTIAYVFPSWPDQQTAKTAARGLMTWMTVDEQHLAETYPLKSCGISQGVFLKWLLFFFTWFLINR